MYVPAVLLAACVPWRPRLVRGGSASSGSSGSSGSGGSGSSGGLKKGLSAYVIPKCSAQYFTVADTAKFGGAIAGLQERGDRHRDQRHGRHPASRSGYQAAITKGANILIVSATDPTALCPTLQSAMSRASPW